MAGAAFAPSHLPCKKQLEAVGAKIYEHACTYNFHHNHTLQQPQRTPNIAMLAEMKWCHLDMHAAHALLGNFLGYSPPFRASPTPAPALFLSLLSFVLPQRLKCRAIPLMQPQER